MLAFLASFFGKPSRANFAKRATPRGAYLYDKPREVSPYNRECWR